MESVFTYILLCGGIILQMFNIYTYYSFIRNSAVDVLSTGDRHDRILSDLSLALLVFFFCGYIFVTVSGRATLIVGAIFFFGAIFCAIMIHLVIRLTATAKRRSIDLVKTLIKVIEERDANLNGHSLYVQNVTMCIWRHLPDIIKSSINAVNLEYAALLHDVGKLGIPESILNKPGKLDDEEWEIMKQHPRKGVAILKELQSFESILPWIEYHHERIDGKGYYGIPGKDIPLEARIIAVADTYSAITMRRSYKPSKTYDEAINIIEAVAGTQLDADLVDIFYEIPRAELEACAPNNIEIAE